ncbi:AMP-binding protein [Actinophytocola oryzae]|uniref:AMP-binding enzyme n=1 Tax=Actinophytocola oryzae TaxID=502181 RepID=A0A4R7V326_9PSEU|nr:AMP-binding enzyme [Actinophytocola oryzae]
MTGGTGVDDLGSVVTHAAQRWPYRIAWTFPGVERLTFTEIEQRTAGYAHALRRRGVQTGDRVALMLRNRPEFFLLWLGLARLGATTVPMNVKYRTADASHVLVHSDAVLAITEPDLRSALTEVATVPSSTWNRSARYWG